MAIVGLVDYGAGNMQSLANAVVHVGADVRLVTQEQQLAELTHVILPGVGAFGHCAERLRASGLLPALTEWAFGRSAPILGICVGMQLLADTSEELGEQAGLGWVGGQVRKLVSDRREIRVPHVGWNTVTFTQDFGELEAGAEADFYFDHSFAYRDPPHGQSLATCLHGQLFCAAVRRGNIVGAQFHPEKSQSAGMEFLRAFLAP